MKKIPNILTTIRLFMVPLFIWAYFKNPICGAVIFVLACVTDIIDGYLARKYNAISNYGILIDPLADKLMQISAVVCLFISEIIPQWIVTVLIMKELIMIISATFLYKKKVIIPATRVGKASTVIISAMVVYFMIFGDKTGNANEIISAVLGIVAFLVLVSYIIVTIKCLVKKEDREEIK